MLRNAVTASHTVLQLHNGQGFECPTFFSLSYSRISVILVGAFDCICKLSISSMTHAFVLFYAKLFSLPFW